MKASASLFLLFGCCCLALLQCDRTRLGASAAAPAAPQRIHGLNLVAPPEPFDRNPMPAVERVGAEWIAVIPYAYSRPGEARVHFSGLRWQWWGESREGARETIALAKRHGLKVLLKPQVYVPGSWTGAIDFETEAAWQAWERDYEAYILPLAGVAQMQQADMFCIGTEFKASSRKRPGFWKALIRKIRERYDGPLTYAANWDEYEQVPFWQKLDYIGVDAYFPLLDEPTPEVAALRKSWGPYCARLARFAARQDKPVLFTEYGYLSVDGCAWNTWELEARLDHIPINEQAQANALKALYQTFDSERWWAGGFLWKWFPNMRGHEGYPAKDYTPQGKLGEEVVKTWYDGTGRSR